MNLHRPIRRRQAAYTMVELMDGEAEGVSELIWIAFFDQMAS